jgi:hypothetical protein
MKTKALTVLLVLNALLFGAGLYFFRAYSNLASSMPATVSVAEAKPKLETPRKKNPPQAKPPLPTPPAVVFVTNQFHWNSVESTDYREYIGNLRRIGCPESTIKDIIMTDIMRLYAARRGQFYHNGREFKFWETNEKRKLNVKQLEEREQQLALIDKEIPAVLRELLGINYERELNRYFVDTNEDERRLNFVSEEKRSRLLALRDEIETMREKAHGAGDANVTREELAHIDEHRRKTLASILTPTELEEFELRTSETADRLRNELIGFNPTEEEFRQIYARQRAFEERFASVDPNDQEAQAAKFIEQSRMDAEIRQQLGEGRYAELQQAREPEFQSAVLFTELYELPQSTAATIVEIKQVAERGRIALFANRNIPAESRAEALRAIQTETEQSLLEILGPKVMSSYTQSSGKWIQDLASN